MDSYLDLAREVLKSSRQPLSARQILRTAHQLQLVPRDLYGRTQHKTLQARLSTDILKHRSKSVFYRTGPGRFFLRAFQSDDSIPPRHRQEYQAPLRAAQLGRFDVVAFPRVEIAKLAAKLASPFAISNLHSVAWRFARLYNLRRDAKLIPFRFQLILAVDGRLYLDNRKTVIEGDIPNKSMVGIEGFLKRGDLSLFSEDDFGLIDAATRTLFEQFELSRHVLPAILENARWSRAFAVVEEGHDQTNTDFVVYLSFQCAGISELIDAIEARAGAEWLHLPIKLNHFERFDTWSERFITDAKLQSALLDYSIASNTFASETR